MDDEITIDSQHIYRVRGEIFPSSTQVLAEYIKTEIYGETWWIHTPTSSAIADHIMEKGRQIGNAIHKIAFYILMGKGIEEDTLNPILIGPYCQIMQFVDKYKPEAILCEKPLVSRRYRYAGTPDLFANIKGKSSLIDIKTGVGSLVGPQVASYEKLIHENEYKGVIDKYVLRIPKDGRDYSLTKLTGKDDFLFFLNRLNQYHYFRRLQQ